MEVATKQIVEYPDRKDAGCLHCGNFLNADQSQFCCQGCAVVYHSILRLGLTEFYSYRDGKPAPVQFIPGNDTYTWLDQPLAFREHTKILEDGRVVAEFLLQGIHCTGCVWLIEGLPKLMPGLKSARVNFTTGKLTLEIDPDKIRLSQIAALLDSLGYRILPLHSEREESLAPNRTFLLQLGVAAFCSMNVMVLSVSLYQGIISGIESKYAELFRWLSLLLTIPTVTYCALPFYKAAWLGIRFRKMQIELPLSLAIIAGFMISAYNTVNGRESVYFDSVALVVFLLLSGRIIQARALRKARAAARLSWSILPSSANLIEGEAIKDVPIEALKCNDKIIVYAGERIPADGIIACGTSSIDCSVLSGESEAIPAMPDQTVYAGTLNIEAPLTIQISSLGVETRIGRLLNSLDEYGAKRGQISQLIDRASSYFVWAVLALATVTLSIWWQYSPALAIDHTLALLIVSCPCALGLAVPLALGVAISKASQTGILIKGIEAIERISLVTKLCIDKTGTLTEPLPRLAEKRILINKDKDEEDLVMGIILSLCETTRTHPISQTLRTYLLALGTEKSSLSQSTAVVGRGVEGTTIDHKAVRLGSINWLTSINPLPATAKSQINAWTTQGQTVIGLTIDGELAVIMAFENRLKERAKEEVMILKDLGLDLVILSGDSSAVVKNTANALDITEAYGELSPQEKAQYVLQMPGVKGMVGDGVNDCLAFKVSDIAISLRGGIESNLEISDIYIAKPELHHVVKLFKGARKVMRTIRKTLALSVTYNIVGALAAMLGWINPVVAAFLMPISSLTVVSIALFSESFTAD